MRPRLFRRAVAAAFAITLGCGMAGCDSDRDSATRVVVIGEKLEMTDPSSGPMTEPQAVLLANVAQGLVGFDARGEIVPGLAERWNVTDDGLSYIFRLAPAEWADGRRVTARQVARILKRHIAERSRNPLKDSMGAVEDVVGMTDRVMEIRLKAPRPNLLQLLAQPEFALVREGVGTGPFTIDKDFPNRHALRLQRSVPVPDSEEEREEEVRLSALPAREAVALFQRGEVDLVLGGRFTDLPLATSARLPRGALRFDPVSGVFGLVPARNSGPLAEPEVRRLLTQAIDRAALIAVLAVPGLLPRATVLEARLEGLADPLPPAWMATPLAERRSALAAEAARLFGSERPTFRVALPEGPGADLLLERLAADWGALGIQVERASSPASADLRLIDQVAPSTSPAWFLRHFRCEAAALCNEELDRLLDAARAAPVPAQRLALLGEAARLIDDQQLFLPLAAPVRWALVSNAVQGFAGNRFARHTLTGLRQRLDRERGE